MYLRNLFDADWNSYERKRFLKDSPKKKTDSFDPESFKHDGFNNREKYIEIYVPALADDARLRVELTNFTPPRVGSINGSPYQALVIRYGVLKTLIRQPGLAMEKDALLESVQSWQREIIDEFDQGDFNESNELLHLAQAAVEHDNDIDDSELNLIYSYMEFHNRTKDWKHQYHTWQDVFERLSTLDRFPKVSRSEKPEHALDTIEKGVWSLQEQAIVYEIVTEDGEDILGIPEDYKEFIGDWLVYEMSDENYLTMVNTLEPFQRQSLLIEATDTFDINKKNYGKNQKRRENIVEAGIFPTDLFAAVVQKDDLKAIVDEFGLDAHKRRRHEMIDATIEYFEQSQRGVEAEQPRVSLYLDFYDTIADGEIDEIPPQLQGLVDESDKAKKLEILFEEATAEIFREVFNLDGTEQLGQQASGSVADGEIEQDGKWLLWDNKRRAGQFKLGSTTRSKIKNYIDTKAQQHDVQWFLIIAPEFTDSARENANLMEKHLEGVDIRLVRAEDFQELAHFWQDSFQDSNKPFPLSMFNGSDVLRIDTLTRALKRDFA